MTENTAATEDHFTADVTTFRNDALHRYELHVGGKLAVEVRFEDKPGHVDFIHTQTSEQFQGHGLAQGAHPLCPSTTLWRRVNGSFRIARLPARYLRKHEIYTQCIDWPEAAAPKLLGT
jgi:hypothetical protein